MPDIIIESDRFIPRINPWQGFVWQTESADEVQLYYTMQFRWQRLTSTFRFRTVIVCRTDCKSNNSVQCVSTFLDTFYFFQSVLMGERVTVWRTKFKTHRRYEGKKKQITFADNLSKKIDRFITLYSYYYRIQNYYYTW